MFKRGNMGTKPQNGPSASAPVRERVHRPLDTEAQTPTVAVGMVGKRLYYDDLIAYS